MSGLPTVLFAHLDQGGENVVPGLLLQHHLIGLKGWNKCEVANAAIFIAGNSATTLGKVSFTAKDGKVTTVDKTWSFVKDDAGKLRIVLHHSSLEYTGS